jgi:hypothetical protein
VIAVKTNPALDAGSRPATEARADFKPPATPAAFPLRCRTKVLPGGAMPASRLRYASHVTRELRVDDYCSAPTPRCIHGFPRF